MASVEHNAEQIIPNNEIWYTNGSTTEATTPYKTNVFGANIVSNTYDAAKECWVIKFDGEVTTIGREAFYKCSNLKSITIPNSVTTIVEYAFYDCSGLTSVTIPDSLIRIGGEGAFFGCSSLTSVYISDISAWCNISFADLYSNPLSNGCNLYLNNELVTDLTIPDSVTTVGGWAFSGCSSLTSVTIPDSVTTIGRWAFRSCDSLTSVTIGDSVTSIGEEAFRSCASLTSVTIPDSVTTIGRYAFQG
ncbi:MAG: leucine-rich repeat domain-containing protein, partial [Alistipes sp.]|nr:leucine-rich repeat domain-containing protein [Alistipes sp.]